MAEVKFQNVTKAFGETVAVKDLNLTVNDKEFLVLVGPSGCGKTTTLRMLAGLEETTTGRILIDGKDVTPLPPKDRDIAMVFQSYALYPHMDVYDNIAFGLRNRLITPKAKLEKTLVSLFVWGLIIASIWFIGYIIELILGKGFSQMILFGGIGAFLLALTLYSDFRGAIAWNAMKVLARFDTTARDYIEKEKLIEEKVHWATGVLEIEELLNRKPRQLSGGQRQRVALGRAIVREPKVFLMDEPLSNLDAKLRNSMRAELAELQEKLKITTVYVTHDQVEAMTLGHRIAVMNKGVIEQIGTPDEVYSKPQSLFVAGFIGTPTMNFIEGTLQQGKKGLELKTDTLTLPIIHKELEKTLKPYIGKEVVMGIRPENISLQPIEENNVELTGRVSFVEPIGSVTHIYFHVKELNLIASVEGYRRLHTGDEMPIFLQTDFLHFFDKETQKRIN